MCVIHLHILAWFWSFHVVLPELACFKNLFLFVLVAVCFEQVVIQFFQIRCYPALFDWTILRWVQWRVTRKTSVHFLTKCRRMLIRSFHCLLSHSHCQFLLHCIHTFFMWLDYGFLPSPCLDYIFEEGWATCDVWREKAPATLLLHHIIFQYRSEIRNEFKEMILGRVQSFSDGLFGE